MPYFINPDGTITTLAVEYDSAGRMRIKKKNNTDEIPYTTLATKSGRAKTKRKKKKKQEAPLIQAPNKNHHPVGDKIGHTPKKVLSSEIEIDKIVNVRLFLTRQSIDSFFKKRKQLGQPVPTEVYMYAVRTLKDNLLGYFLKQYDEYKKYRKQMGWDKPKETTNKKKKKQKMDRTSSYSHNERPRSGHTLADIATISSLREGTSEDSTINGRSIYGASRHPKYGYARDRYGRVQDRDSFNEEKFNEFQQAQKRQSGYDYSAYDDADDHDSYYDSPGYD